ncbi:MAG: alpha-ketoglutarate-dependent dioxygenase AlkB, partial [Nitrososphaeraceae archaeon]|nr:alpha-ketoglutarate-dependent dioxygenase AlkB [Nitrososphaeraceae archaeon]
MIIFFIKMLPQKEIVKLTDGIVIIRNFLTIEEQTKLIEITENFGKLFNDYGDPNFSKTRARNYSNLDDYGQDAKTYMKDICHKTMVDIKSVDQLIPNSNPTHLLTLYYVTKKGMGWHKDDGGNDGDFDTPVISFTIGNSCVFDYKIDEVIYSNQLNSGDV